MKKLVSVILALLMTVSMLVACERQKPQATDTTTTNYVESHSENAELRDKQISKSIAERFLSGIKNKDPQQLLDTIAAKDADAYKFLTDLKLESYNIVEEIEVYSSVMKYVVQLDITESNSDFFPVGRSSWELEVDYLFRGKVILFKPVGKDLNRLEFDNQNKDVNFCADFFELLEPYIISASDLNKMVPEIKDADSYNDFLELMIIFLRRYGLPEENTPADSVMAEAKKVLGITEIDLQKYNQYHEDDRTVSTRMTSGIVHCGSLSSREYDPQTKQSAITLDYYSDSAHLLKGKTVKFIVKENEDKSFTMLSIEVLYDSDLELTYFIC